MFVDWKLKAYFINFRISYQENCYLQYVNLFSDHILTMVTLFTNYNASFNKWMESLQYSAALALADDIRGTSKEKLYYELGLESLQNKWWCRKLSFLYKAIVNQSLS